MSSLERRKSIHRLSHLAPSFTNVGFKVLPSLSQEVLQIGPVSGCMDPGAPPQWPGISFLTSSGLRLITSQNSSQPVTLARLQLRLKAQDSKP